MSINAASITFPTLFVLLLVLAAGAITFFVARMVRGPGADDAPFGVIQAGAFGLIGLLLGFSFSLAVGRYDQRRAVTVKEANAIGTTALRVQLLEQPVEQQMWTVLREYAAARYDFASAVAGQRDEPARRSTKLQEQMWALAMRAAHDDPRSTMTPLFIATLNDTIDVSAEQAAALNATIPAQVLNVLVLVMLLAASLLGAHFGRTGRFEIIPFTAFALMLALTYAVILDLDQPQRGFIKVPLDPLSSVKAQLSGPIPSPTAPPITR
ncbi:MAG: hypothetical protein JO293_01695 [Candidatus Eremiobacteraeota bacterium]|nr:hypothetical protein [Candidatus Eremiobacteraeota bacterium]MBV8222049.1 hypothetical protein [Candidatus Eremiobacteraeota bacterium]MBV8280967.1 hypothetical protein [Candidatus Eremiobacteraeota bacterium]